MLIYVSMLSSKLSETQKKDEIIPLSYLIFQQHYIH